MGFGSYDESEQENQEIEADLEEESVAADASEHDGNVEFNNGASNDELIDRLEDIKDGNAG